jgi:hypothetical protein
VLSTRTEPGRAASLGAGGSGRFDDARKSLEKKFKGNKRVHGLRRREIRENTHPRSTSLVALVAQESPEKVAKAS